MREYVSIYSTVLDLVTVNPYDWPKSDIHFFCISHSLSGMVSKKYNKKK